MERVRCQQETPMCSPPLLHSVPLHPALPPLVWPCCTPTAQHEVPFLDFCFLSVDLGGTLPLARHAILCKNFQHLRTLIQDFAFNKVSNTQYPTLAKSAEFVAAVYHRCLAQVEATGKCGPPALPRHELEEARTSCHLPLYVTKNSQISPVQSIR